MKAAVLKAPGHFEIQEVPVPKCPADGLLVKIGACSICSTDVKMFYRGHRDLSYPRIPGHEIAGVVVESRNDLFKSGTRVQIAPGVSCGECLSCRRGMENQCENIGIIGFTHDGGFSEFIAIEPQSLACGAVNLIPNEISFKEAALVEPLACCINGQELSRITEGDTVLIVGGGPVGCLHAMLARAKGAKKVLLAECLSNRIELIGRYLTLDFLINPLKDDIKEVVQKETKGKGVDVVLLACREAIKDPLIELLAPGGRVCLFSGLPQDRAQINVNLLHYRELSLVGAYGCTAAQNKAALQLIASGKVQVGWLITKQIFLGQIRKGLEYCAQRKGFKAVVIF